MSLFDDPEWGSSQIFTYYPSPESAISSSADIKQNFKNKRKSIKNLDSNKKIKLSDEGKSGKCNKNIEKFLRGNRSKELEKTLNQKTSTKKKNKSSDIRKQSQNKTISSQENSSIPRTVGDEKLVNKEEQDQAKTQIVSVKKKKKKKASSKRNKYKELHIEQSKRKSGMLVNGLTGETSNNTPNIVRSLESELPKDCTFNGNGNKDNGKSQAVLSIAHQTLTNTAVSLEPEICQIEKTDISAKAVGKRIPKKPGKNNKISKKTVSKADSAAASQRLDKIVSAEVTDTHEIRKNLCEVKDKINSEISCKNKKKKQFSKASNGCASQTLDLGSVTKNGTDITFQVSDVNKKEKGKRKREKVTKIDENVSSKKKTKKDTQEKGLSSHCNDEDKLSNKKKKGKDRVSVSKEQKEEEFEAKEFEGDDADSDLEHDLDVYLKELNFDRFKHNVDDDSDAMSASEEIEVHSDEVWESDDSISDEESAEEHTEGNVSSKAADTTDASGATKHVKEKIRKGSEKAAEDNSDIVISKEKEVNNQATPNKEKKFDVAVLTEMLKNTRNNTEEADTKKESKPVVHTAEALKKKMMDQLNAARFRFVNEQMYTSTSNDALKMFKSDPKSFESYHMGFQSQVAQWPVNPLDLIIKWLKNKPKKWVVADFGCGEAVLAEKVSQEIVHSFDLAAANSRVTVCDMSHTPLPSDSVDVVVFCLSLMGTNIKDFILEANRVLHEGGIMKIAEVESRFSDVDYFINHVKKFGFHCAFKDTTMKYFYVFDFKKHRSLKNKKDLPNIILKPCKYKKR